MSASQDDRDEKIRKQWERFITPKELRSNLIMASLYIAAFEILKNTVVERAREFFTSGFDENGDIIDSDYQTEVLSKNKSPVYASLEWFKEINAINQKDIAIFDEAKKLRNKVAHEITQLLGDGIPPELPAQFQEISLLLGKIERWWVVNMEIPFDPDLFGKEIDEEGIIPMRIATLKIMVDVALGSDEEAEYYLDAFIKHGLIKPAPNSDGSYEQ